MLRYLLTYLRRKLFPNSPTARIRKARILQPVPKAEKSITAVSAHFLTTGPEIWNDTDGNVDIFVAGVGTGGTVTGVGRYLKSKNEAVKIIAVEPQSSPVLSKGKSGAHAIQGIGAGFVPEILDTHVYDRVLTVSDADALSAMRETVKREGLFIGISSGAALCAGIELAKSEENTGKNIVLLFPDGGDRYLSVI